MEGILDSLSELIAAADATAPEASFGPRAMDELNAARALSVFVADQRGGPIAADRLPSQAGSEPIDQLVWRLAMRFADQEGSIAQEPRDPRGAWAVAARLPGADNAILVGAEFPPGPAPCDESSAALRLIGALACAWAEKGLESRIMRTRLNQLLAQLDALRQSHTEVLTAATEEREERLREQDGHVQQLRAVMMMAADGIFTADERGVVESFNRAAGSLFGYEPTEVIGRELPMLIPAWPGKGQEELKAPGTPGKDDVPTPRHEVVGRRKDGTTFPMDLAVSEVRLGDRTILTGIFRDITRRKKAEDTLRRLHLQNELILNSAAEGILGVDNAGILIFANDAAAKMLGWDVAELAGRPFHETIHHTRADGLPSPAEECPLRTGLHQAHVSNELFWRKDGTSFPVECASTPIREQSELEGVVLTFRDVSERRLLEAQLRQAQKLESIGQLAAGIAHEINTPTQYIGDNLRFLEESFGDLRETLTLAVALDQPAAGDGDRQAALAAFHAAVDRADLPYLLQEIPKAISQSLEGVERVAKIVRSMKEFSHPSGEGFQAIDLNRAIESALTVSRNEWKYVAEAVTDLDPNLPLVACLPGDINQVLLNLIVNAAHAIGDRLGQESSRQGRIVVRTRRDGPWVEIRVKDNGSGISKEIRSRVYDPFFTTKPVGKGTGQGLAICHSIVTEKHHGTITFESEVGRGTTFVLRLPVDPKTTGRGDRSDA
jgi:PAS domain S-box-containing protein